VQQPTKCSENEDDFFAIKQLRQLEHQSPQEKQYFVHTGPTSVAANVDHCTDAIPEPEPLAMGSQFFPLLLSHSALPSCRVFNSAEFSPELNPSGPTPAVLRGQPEAGFPWQMASPQLSDRQFKPRCIPGFMNSTTVHFDLFPVPQTALSSHSNFMCMGAESTEYLTKTYDSECAYDFLSPRALHQSKFAEDGDPGVLDERFFPPEVSSKPITESQTTTASATNPIQEIYFQEAIEEFLILTPDFDATVLNFQTEQMTTSTATPSNAPYSSAELHPPGPGSQAAQKPVKKKDEILAALKYEVLTEKEIHLRCGQSQYVRTLLRELLRDGLIVRAGQGGSVDPFRYRAHNNIQ
jgi:hypothetical protein